jgi:serine O-acetyltransferase
MILCDISLSEIPGSTSFPHPIGIVIKTGTRIGENCTIYQGVTIGNHGMIQQTPATIGNNVTIFTDALILGTVEIGNNAVIGARQIITKNIHNI